MFTEIYVLLLAGLIPFFSWQQREEGRNLVAMLITGVFLLLWLFTGIPIVWDNTTSLTLCFALWMVASIFWSYSRQSSQDLFFMLSCLVVFLISRHIQFNILLPILFIPGVIFAGASLIFYKAKHPKKKYPIFGNRNHLGAFLLIPLFTGTWLTLNLSWYLAPLVVLIGVAISLCKCRGAQVGAIIGLMYVLCVQYVLALGLIPIFFIITYLICRSRGKNFYASTSGRISLVVAVLLLIKKAPLAGHGLRTFRREYPTIIPKLLNSKILKHFYSRGTPIENSKSHRVHNDHLEIIFELGIIGYLLLIGLFSSLMWTENLVLSGAIIAFAVHGFFFFPLREAHTAFPFWALAGGLASTTASVIILPELISLVFIFIVCRIMYFVGIRVLGLSYYDRHVSIAVLPNPTDAVGKKALKQKQFWINQAIKCDPYNNVYLTDGYYFNVFDHPEVAFQFASRCMENYDGGKVRWGVCDQYARALIRLGGFGVAKMAVNFALTLCPDFKQSRDLLAQIQQLEDQAQKTAKENIS